MKQAPWRMVVKDEKRGYYGGRGASFGYVVLPLECGHIATRSCAQPEPKRVRCKDCARDEPAAEAKREG